ncbi:MAG: carbon monoxide dehydrogenase subunit G [Rhizobiales bacterium]|nr:carbon monoxide dehydrogenase subunit G [Hyphomicrobiales bacterium]
MKMNGEEIIEAPIETVWKALNDPGILKQCIPGCESITLTSPTEMKARVTVKLGPVKAGFNGIVHLKDLNPPNSYRIEGKGDGGIAGQASGGATVNLESVPEGTRMTYDVDAQVGGKMAMLGSRLIDSTARNMAGQFFDKFAKLASEMGAAAPAVAEAPARAATKAPAKKVPAKKAAAKKVPAKKVAAKKATAKKATKKTPAKKKARKK